MQVQFTSPLITELVDETAPTYMLAEPFCYSVNTVKKCVPAGFLTDFASVPRLPFAYLLVGNIGQKAAVIHDWLYSEGKVDRAWADSVFYHALAECNVGWFKRQAMYRAVRWFGAAHFKTKKE